MVVIWNDSALEDLAGIRQYISEDSEYYADKLIDKIIKKVDDRIENYPESGQVVRERNDESIREVKEGVTGSFTKSLLTILKYFISDIQQDCSNKSSPQKII